MYECVGDLVKKPKYLPAQFDVCTYNIIMFCWMCLATISFALLHWCVPLEHKFIKTTDEINNATNGNELVPLQVIFFLNLNLLLCFCIAFLFFALN